MHNTIISSQTLFENLHHNWIIVDCRYSLFEPKKGKEDYLKSHIPNAIYAHLDDDLSGTIIPGKTGRHPLPSLSEMVQLFSNWGIEAGTQVVAYDDKSGAIAARLWWMLRYLGHDQVAVLDGGWNKWVDMEYPTIELVELPKPKTFIPRKNDDWIADASNVLEVIGNGGEQLIDSRASNRYRGIEEPIDPIAGHISNAESMPFMENINEDGFFKNAEELQSRFSTLKNSDKKTIFYCGSGVTACHNILATQIFGMPMPKLYPGSWSEWITDPNRPIVQKS